MKLTNVALTFLALVSLGTPVLAQQAMPASFESNHPGRQEVKPGGGRIARYAWCRIGPAGESREVCKNEAEGN